jgi:hypothetical protein
MRGFIGGFIAALIVIAAVSIAAVKTGSLPARADGPLMPGEKWVARTALNAAIAREAPKPPYPYTQTDADIATYFLKRAPDHLPAAAQSIWDDPAQVAQPTPMPAEPARSARTGHAT